MSTLHRRRSRIGVACVTGLALIVGPLLVATPAAANTDGTGVVINEAYLNGGSSGATYLNKFVELYNPTASAVDLSTMSLQYRAAGSSANPTGVQALTGSIPAGGHYLIQGSSNAANGATLPAADDSMGASFAAGSGTLFLANTSTALVAPATGSVLNNENILDLLGYGTSNTFETAPATGNSLTLSFNRTDGIDTDNNAADMTVAAPTPTNSDGETESVETEPTPTPTPTPAPTTPPVNEVPVEASIADIQGTTDTSPLAGQRVTTTGIVTATYATGGFNGYYIQTAGTGGAMSLDGRTSSDAVFVFSEATVGEAQIGRSVQVTGVVTEYMGLTEITVAAGDLADLGEAIPIEPATLAFPTDSAERESLEGMLLAPAGDFTVTNNYDTNYYGAIALTAGTSPLIQPTTVVEPGSAEFDSMMAANAAALVTLDDGASINFNSTANKAIPLPYLSNDEPVRIGAAATFTEPVIVDYRFDAWNFQPQQQLTADNAADVQPVSFENTRTDAPANVGGDATIASFNVLNYFSTTGDELNGCRYYNDREGNPVTVSSGCDVRGAANQTSLDRQQAKIVAAINALDADVVSLAEIENSLAVGQPTRDEALAELTAALNTAAGSELWAYVASPAALPASEDVIRTAFIYKPGIVQTVGDSVIYDDPAFVNARQPLAQAFELVGGDASTGFLAIANHFKSKGSGSGSGNTDIGDGQGASNADRVKQANALVAFADEMKADSGLDRVLLSGDFNSYLKEDPIDVLAAAGYVSLGADTGKETYSFGGMIGSLDHIFANAAAGASVSGTDIWNINSVESIALEYSRFNYNVTNFYEPNAFRSSDHDPLVVGLNLTEGVAPVLPIVDVNLLSINDFHGRIDNNTVKFAGTIEQLRAATGEDSSALISAGDNIGASLFASSSQQDSPTIDVLNALELQASAVGNHEFDAGFEDLTGRVADEANWNYLGANVYDRGTETPAMQEYEIIMVSGLRVAVIGAVTQETPTLVSPAGIATLDFGDPVEAVNRVVDELSANDLADVYVAQYHEGAGAGTLENALGLSASAFADIVTKTSPEVDAIFTGHTHATYAWDVQIPGAAVGETRPVLQTGSYGVNIGQIVLKVDPTDDSVESYTAGNVPVTATPDATLVAEYPRVAEVKTIVDSAIAAAAVIGNEPVGSITSDISTAFTRPLTGPAARDARDSESTLGNLVADSLVATLSPAERGAVEIGVVNPGGLRADLGFASSVAGEGDGVVTFAEANAVLPFVNNLGSTTLTGAQFWTVLEEQWQTNADGTIPSRAFLNLGLSDNVNYTYDATRALGDRITGVTINGSPIDLARDYRIGTFSFLLQGGDNFREFANGANTTDSGLIDRDGWISYITDNSPLSPSFDRRGVSVTGLPTSALELLATGTVQLDKLDLTSTGSPVNTTVSAVFEGSAADGQLSPVVAGSSTVAFTVPADVVGSATLVLTASPSGTVVRVPIAVNSIVVPPIDPTDPVDPTDPAEGDVTDALGTDSLTAELEGLITLSDETVEAGQSIEVFVGTQYAGERVYMFLYSTPTALGSSIVSAAGTVQILIPAGTPAGAHRIAIQDAAGAVIGWANVTVGASAAAGVGLGGSSLAKTGSEIAPLLIGAMLLLTLGGAFVLARGRRSLYPQSSEA